MKNTLLAFCLLAVPCLARGQTIFTATPNTSGATFVSNSYYVQISVGEAVVGTLQTNQHLVTQGVLQPIDKKVAIAELDNQWGIRTFPNPVTDYLQIVPTETDVLSDLRFCFYDMEGRKIATPTLQGDRLNCEQLPIGMYLLEIKNTQKNNIKTLKINKL